MYTYVSSQFNQLQIDLFTFRYAISPSDYTPYFSLGACMEGLQVLMDKLYNIELENVQPDHGEVWAPDVLKLVSIFHFFLGPF